MISEILEKLNRLPSVIGSILVAEDGIVIASELATAVESDVVGALVSAIGTVTKKAISRLQRGEFDIVIIEAEGGKVFITQTTKGFLGVMAERDVNIGMVRLELTSAVEAVNRVKL